LLRRRSVRRAAASRDTGRPDLSWSASPSPKAAFDAIAKTLPVGSVGYENATNARGERYVWLDRAVVDRLRALRGPGEDYSDVILRVAAEVGGLRWRVWIVGFAIMRRRTAVGTNRRNPI
jgi:hypothetical protein